MLPDMRAPWIGLCLPHHIGMQGGRVWERTLIRECHCSCHDFADFLLELFEICLDSQPLTQNRFLQDGKRISLTLLIDFFFSSVMSMCRVGHRVTHKSVGHRLNEKRPLSCTYRLDHPTHHLA